MSPTRKVKVREVAKKMDLSPGTVSKALRGMNGKVSLKTAQRVLDYCRHHGYISSDEARRVIFKMKSTSSQKRVFTLSITSHWAMYQIAHTAFCHRLQEDDIYAQTFAVGIESSLARFPCDHAGVMAILGYVSSGIVEEIISAGVPIVLIDHRTESVFPSAVNSDNLASASRAVKILAELGHKRIAFMCMYEDDPAPIYTFHQRQLGYFAGLGASGITFDEGLLLVENSTRFPDWEGYYAQVRSLSQRFLNLDPRPTAVVAANDLQACILREVLLEHNVKVPEDASIIGYDGMHLLPTWHGGWPPVSTMAVDWERMGTSAAELALDKLYEPEQSSGYLEVPTVYEDAGTVCPPRTRET